MNEYDYEKGVFVVTTREDVIQGLLLNGSIQKTADSLNVSKSTIYRITHEDGSSEDFSKAKQEILQGVCARLTSNLLKAVEVVADIRNNAENSPQIRLNATQQLFNVTLRLTEQCELLERVEKLEKRFDDEQND